MKIKSFEDKFSAEIDGYIQGIEPVSKSKSQEYNSLLDLGKTLADTDFSAKSKEDEVFNKVFKNVENKGDNIMKKCNKRRRPVVIAASLAATVLVTGSLMQTSFAKEMTSKILKAFNVGNYTAVILDEKDEPSEFNIPDEFKGEIVDKNGKAIEVFTKQNRDELYTKTGEKIAYINIKEKRIVTEVQAEAEKKNEGGVVEVKDINKANEKLCFKVNLPTYLPEGYKFEKAELFGDKDDVSDKCVGLTFKSEKTGKTIYMQQRWVCEETKCYGNSGKVEEIKINGVKALLSDDRNLNWESNNVMNFLSLSKSGLSKAELIKIAESMK